MSKPGGVTAKQIYTHMSSLKYGTIQNILKSLVSKRLIIRTAYGRRTGYKYQVSPHRLPQDFIFQMPRFTIGKDDNCTLQDVYTLFLRLGAKPEWDSAFDAINKVLAMLLGHMIYRAHLTNEEWIPVEPSGLSCRRTLTEARRFLLQYSNLLNQLDALPIWEENNESLNKALISDESLDIDTAKRRSEEFRQTFAEYETLIELIQDSVNKGPSSA